MARKDNLKPINQKRMNTLIGTVNDRMRSLYRDTYNTDRTYSDELDTTMDNMEKNIDDIISRNNTHDLNNVTKLVTRAKLQASISDEQINQKVEELFDNDVVSNSLLSSYLMNKSIIELNNEIDTVCKYMPKLQEALDAKKDAVLSSDDYSKDFLNAYLVSDKEEQKDSQFSDRMKSIKKKYDLLTKFELYYNDTSKYGEEFIYNVPYNKAMSDLLRRKNNTKSPSINGFRESVMLLENGIVFDKKLKPQDSSFLTDSRKNKCGIKLEFNFSGLLDSAIQEHETMLESVQQFQEATSLLTEAKKDNIKMDKTITPDQLEMPKDEKSVGSSEGLINIEKTKNDDFNVKIPGCILKRLKQSNTIPIYIDDICLGIYYLEFLNGTDGFDQYANLMYDYNEYGNVGGINLSNRGNLSKETISAQHRQNMLNYISYNIASSIDKNFINNNQDLAKEIYTILKHNDVYNAPNTNQTIRISFLSPDDVIHMKFEEDPDTHRGISDLLRSLIPAKLYSCLYITNTLGILTRGQDKRVYYVKQNIEQNISKTLLNVINQIKRSNFNIRQVESMNTILNLTGRFNDFVIPVGPSGDSPIQFEVMPGQEFNLNQELMESLEEMAVNVTDVPMELINARFSMDFATQITMTNVKFLRHCFNRQSKCEEFYSRILTTIYNTEYNENVEVHCSLPAPVFLQLSNLSNIIENAKNSSEIIASYEYDENDEVEVEKRNIFIKKMMRHKLSTYIKQDEIEALKKETEFEYVRLSTKKKQEENNM